VPDGRTIEPEAVLGAPAVVSLAVVGDAEEVESLVPAVNGVDARSSRRPSSIQAAPPSSAVSFTARSQRQLALRQSARST
jgi:hypothetical protein